MKMKILFVMMALFAATACGSKKKVEPKLKDDPKEYTLVASQAAVTINDSKNFSEPKVYDRTNFGIHARGASNVLVISARNKGEMDITMAPQDFALITGPSKQDLVRISPASADISQFTSLTLKPNDRAVINLPMKEFSNMKGMRLVYNNPRQSILCYVDVE
ncbi:MAG: hypothetical protein ABI579_00160 [Candidatus Sumerlaeota bacterium]